MEDFFIACKNVLLGFFSFLGEHVFNQKSMAAFGGFVSEHKILAAIVIVLAIIVFYFLGRMIKDMLLIALAILVGAGSIYLYFQPHDPIAEWFIFGGIILAGITGFVGVRRLKNVF